MSANTANRAYTYPQSTDTFRPHLDMQELANDVDADVEALELRTQQPPLCVVRNSGTQSVANNGAVLTWNTDDRDTANIHNPAVNPSRLTPNVQGDWQFIATIQWASNTTGRRGVGIRLNGSTIYYGNINPAGTGVQGVTVNVTLPMNGSSDYVECWGFQESGAGLLTHTDLNSTRFEARLVWRT